MDIAMILNIIVKGHDHLMCRLADGKIPYLPIIRHERPADVIEQLKLFRELEGEGITGSVAMSVRKCPGIIQGYLGINIIYTVRNCASVWPVYSHRYTGNDVRFMINGRCFNL
ncbi:hypothetical protein D3C75_646380 [compost metagenome]